jgi:hypothetical protein
LPRLSICGADRLSAQRRHVRGAGAECIIPLRACMERPAARQQDGAVRTYEGLVRLRAKLIF